MAVINVTLLDGSGGYFRGVRLGPPPVREGGCVTIEEQGVACDGKHAWYRVTSEKPGSGGCSGRRRRSENGKHCLEILRPVEVDVDVDVPPLRTP